VPSEFADEARQIIQQVTIEPDSDQT